MKHTEKLISMVGDIKLVGWEILRELEKSIIERDRVNSDIARNEKIKNSISLINRAFGSGSRSQGNHRPSEYYRNKWTNADAILIGLRQQYDNLNDLIKCLIERRDSYRDIGNATKDLFTNGTDLRAEAMNGLKYISIASTNFPNSYSNIWLTWWRDSITLMMLNIGIGTAEALYNAMMPGEGQEPNWVLINRLLNQPYANLNDEQFAALAKVLMSLDVGQQQEFLNAMAQPLLFFDDSGNPITSLIEFGLEEGAVLWQISPGLVAGLQQHLQTMAGSQNNYSTILQMYHLIGMFSASAPGHGMFHESMLMTPQWQQLKPFVSDDNPLSPLLGFTLLGCADSAGITLESVQRSGNPPTNTLQMDFQSHFHVINWPQGLLPSSATTSFNMGSGDPMRILAMDGPSMPTTVVVTEMLTEYNMAEQMRELVTAHNIGQHNFYWGNHLWSESWSAGVGKIPFYSDVAGATNLINPSARRAVEAAIASIENMSEYWRLTNVMLRDDIGSVFIENGALNSTNFIISPWHFGQLGGN